MTSSSVSLQVLHAQKVYSSFYEKVLLDMLSEPSNTLLRVPRSIVFSLHFRLNSKKSLPAAGNVFEVNSLEDAFCVLLFVEEMGRLFVYACCCRRKREKKIIGDNVHLNLFIE